MKIMILTADYESFMKSHYTSNPGLEHQGYGTQLQARFDSMFGVADAYSRNFSGLGHEACEIYVNNIWLNRHGPESMGSKCLRRHQPPSWRRSKPIHSSSV